MITATQTESTITLSNFRVEYRAPRYEDGKVLYDPYCAILADDAALDGAEVRVFDVPDVDEGQLAAAMFACEAMNQHERLIEVLRELGMYTAALEMMLNKNEGAAPRDSKAIQLQRLRL